VIRVLLGERQGLAVVTAGTLSVLWRFFPLPTESETAAICSAVRTTGALISNCGIDSAPDCIMIHGRADLRSKLEDEGFRQQLGTPLIWSEAPSLDDAAVAQGLALGCTGQESTDEFDLSRSLKPRLPLWAVIPWGEAAVQIAVVVCMALFLLMHSGGLDDALKPVQAENAKREWLSSTPEAQLQTEQKDLEQRVNAISKFVSSRVTWTAYTHDLSQRLPAEATLTVFHGLCELESTGKKESVIKPKKQLTFMGVAPIADDGSIPKEVDTFLTALRDDPLLKRDFPVVELDEIKWFQPNITAPPDALFTVICLPKPMAAPAKSADGKDKGKAGKE
jgi:hypothetical protein